jgi:hypothetical protein
MGAYFPQASIILRIRWEDFGETQNEVLQKVYELPVWAKRVSVSINDYTQADTFRAEIDYKNFPFDPRCIRACGVKIAMEDMGAIFRSDNGLEAIAQRTDAPGRPGNIIFVGFADEESISFNDSERVVRLEGRDFTSLLIDKKFLLGAVNLERPVDEVLSELLSQAEDTRELKLDNRVVDNQGNPVPLPVLSSFWSDKDELSGKRSRKKDESYWDVIQDIAGRAALIAYVELDRLVLTKPRFIYDRTRYARFVYGRNITNLEFKRKLGRRKNFNIVVRSINPNNKADPIIEAKIPMEATDEWARVTGINNAEVKIARVKADATGTTPEEEVAPYIAFKVPNVTSKDQLIEIGQEVYEEIGRQQIEGSFQTKEMETADSSQPANAFDVLKVRNGTPIKVLIDQGDMKGFEKLAQNQSVSLNQRVRFLISRGYTPAVAQAFAESYGKFGSLLYTKAVEFTLDESQGFSAKVEFVNRIEVTNKAFAGT